MKIAGVDPGAFGAVAIYDTALGTLELIDMPTRIEKVRTEKRTRVDSAELGLRLHGRTIDEACIEKVASRQNQGVASMFAFGKAAGIVEGVFAGLLVPVSFLRPQEWQRLARVAGGEFVKDNARDRAVMLFPAYAAWFGRKKDSGRADAALIAYARAIELGEA